MRLIFCGTPQFAVPTLEALIARRFQIGLVVTNPDEPSGRSYELKPPPVKVAAEKAGLRVYQPKRLKDADTQAFISNHRPDAIVIVAYGHLIPPWMIDLPRLGCINLHASLLPKYRGAAPIAWALIRGERVTGVTTMKIDTGLDTGDMLLRRETEIRDDDTTETLSGRLSAIGAELMVETLERLERGGIVPQPQDHAQATLAPRLKKEDGRIDWALAAEDIARRVRGLQPWPGAYTTLRGKNLRLWAAAATAKSPPTSEPGTVLVSGDKLLVACGQETTLEIRELQLEGRKRMSARDFLNGVHVKEQERFGSAA
ncbi:MAG TPA: methionyl-tRNA formyltransferase [Terriglobia bacterium]|nr:methionyl-tRNA formyltransferase [Terriglobia bacterium]